MQDAAKLPKVLGPNLLSNSFLGDTVQVCVVTHDYRKAMAGFVKLGIGPWRVLEFNSSNTRDMTYRGRRADYSMKLCLANSGGTNWEIIQPLKGPSIYTEFLERHGEGVQHVAFNCSDMNYEARIRLFEERGYQMVQSGVFMGRIPYHYFATEADTLTIFEIYNVPEGFSPEPEEWYPAPPP